MENKVKIDKNIVYEGDENWVTYIDTDSLYIHFHPILRSLYSNFDNLEEQEKENLLEKESQKLQEKINEYYDDLIPKLFNVKKENHRFKMQTEAVIKSAYFRATRRYAQWIVKEKGIRVDKIDIKGLEINKSNISKLFGSFTISLLERALKEEKEDVLANEVLKFKNEILEGKYSIEQIATPTSVKTLNDYLENSAQKGELFSTLKIRAPAPVKAAWAYNDLVKYWGLRKDQYVYISASDKIKWVYLKNNPYQISTIAFISGLVPPKIMEFIERYIDYNKIFEKSLLNKIQGLFNDINMEIKLNKYSEDFFEF